MQYDFWNNPLVVSAMRLKYRRSSPGIITCLYLLVLLTIGTTIHYYQQSVGNPPGLTFLLVILGLQFLLSGGLALFTVAASLNAEVMNRTLDFQRIVSLPPHEILLGKMLGEPALSYLLTIASIPFAIFCWAEGSAPLGVIAWFYVNLLTFTLLCAAVGSLHPLTPPKAGSATAKNGSFGVVFFVFPAIMLPSIMSSGGGWLQDSWMGSAMNLCLPLGPLKFLYAGSAWDAQVMLWGYGIPSLVIAPVTQLLFTFWILMMMSSRLKNPVDPPMRRSYTYLALFVFDLLMAGACYSEWLNSMPVDRLVVQFCAVHLAVSLILLFGITPNKPVLISWLWRARERKPSWRNAFFARRSAITMVLPVYCLIGAGVLLAGFALPTAMSSSGLRTADNSVYVSLLAVTSALLLAFGLLHQVCVALIGRSGLMMYAVGLLLINLVPIIVAAVMVYPNELVTARGLSRIVVGLSPGFFYLSSYLGQTTELLPLAFLIIAALGLAAGCFWFLWRWFSLQQSTVAKKLASMEAE